MPTDELSLRKPLGLGLWSGIVLWTAGWAYALATPSGVSWHFFALGARELLHGSHLRLYAEHPDLQIGPLTFVVAAPLTVLGSHAALVAAQILMTAMLPVALWLIAPRIEGPDRALRLAGVALLLAPAWAVLAVRWAHLDDALALLLLCALVRAALDDRGATSGVLLALAFDAKPWAAIGLPLLLLLSTTSRVRALVAAAAGVIALWGPFLATDFGGTLAALRPEITLSDTSTLGVLGYGGVMMPSWVRTAQLLLAPAVALIAVSRHRWAGALLCGVAVRLVLDPQNIGYYAAGAVLTAAIFDLFAVRRRVPWATLITALAYWQPFVVDFAHRLTTSHGLTLWWFEHPVAVAISHVIWSAAALVAVAVVRPPALRRMSTRTLVGAPLNTGSHDRPPDLAG